MKAQDEFIEEQIEEEKWKESTEAQEKKRNLDSIMKDIRGSDTVLGIAEKDEGLLIIQYGIDRSMNGFVYAMGMIDVLRSETMHALESRFLRGPGLDQMKKIEDILCAQICKNQTPS